MDIEEAMDKLSTVLREWSLHNYTNLLHTDRGLCSNITNLALSYNPDLFDMIASLLNDGWTEWEHFSGDNWYPIVGSEVGGMYTKRERWGSDEEADLRRDLSGCMSKYLKENWRDVYDGVRVLNY